MSRLISFGNITDAIVKYVEQGGSGIGLSTGWYEVDKYIKLMKGLLYVITGIPSSGKSEIMDAVMLQSIALHEWHWTIFSPENWPLPHHFQKLSEKWIGKPMFGKFSIENMTMTEIKVSKEDLSSFVSFIEPDEGDVSIDSLLKMVQRSKEENGTDAFLLDPWNECEHIRPNNMSETEYIGQCLSKMRNFARHNNIAIFIVAHPTKLQKKDDGTYPVPTPYDISGSSNWRNKADVCMAVWRDYHEQQDQVQLHIQKVRNKNLGQLGYVNLWWNRANGLFFDTIQNLSNTEIHGIKKIIR